MRLIKFTRQDLGKTFKKITLFSLCILLQSFANKAFTQITFPTAAELASEMKVGWNIGNTMEALYENNGTIVAGETAWGNPLITQTLIDGVKAAGFNTIRIPVAWDVHATNGTIDPTWLARVKEVVDYCYNQDLYVMINIHWDNGWLEENCTLDKQEENNIKQADYWNQIATYFKDYDEHLLFASANEPHVADATEMGVLLSYHQTFVNTVRASGGNNHQRILIVQGPATDIEKTNDLMNTMPTDPTPDRMMAEVHFYPYQFSLMQADEAWGNQFYYWGACNHSTTDAAHNPTWGEEAYVDEMFQLMKTKFVDQGYPVILGEFGARLRTNLSGANFDLHKQSREYFLKYVTRSALNHGMIPVYWCAGLGELFNRNTGELLEPETAHALMAGAYTNSATVNCGGNDCQGTPFGHAYTNQCNNCVLGYDAACENTTTDCNGDENGTASIDNCGECSGGNTGVTPNSTCEQDCNGEWGGSASLDNCDVCSGGSTGIVPNSSCCNVQVENDTICEAGTVSFTITEPGNYTWYDAPENGNELEVGTTFSTGITSNTSFYVESSGTASITFGRSTQGTDGWADNVFDDASKQIKITVTETIILEAISVFVTVDPTDVVINIVNTATAQTVGSGSANGLNTGKRRIPMDVVLQPGEYTINGIGTTNSLHFQTSDAAFPYTAGDGAISFSNNVSWATNWYGFFYDWEVAVGASCVRTEVIGVIDPSNEKCAEIDTDEDGTPDDEDACPNDPEKAASVGDCGCGVADTDSDGDGIADCNDSFPNDFDNDGVATTDDCDDNDAGIGTATTWYEDADNDGLGNSAVSTVACDQPIGYVSNDTDTNDDDADNDGIASGTDCNDNDENIGEATIWSQDADGDGLGNGAVQVTACTQPAGYVNNNQDLNDNDFDNDGIETEEDCDDSDDAIGEAVTWYEDVDGDGLGTASSTMEACTKPSGYVDNAGDTNDNDFDNDGISTNNDCDDNNMAIGAASTWYEDVDNDGVGDATSTMLACSQPVGYVATSGDECPNDINKTDPGNCGCGETEESCKDCAGIPNGTAEYDDCGVCGGTNACVDCNGEPNGGAAEDACGTCAGGSTGITPVTDPQNCIATSIEEYEAREQRIFPNPTTGLLHVKTVSNWALLDMTGEVLDKGSSDHLSLEAYPPGIYFLRIDDEVIKVIKE